MFLLWFLGLLLFSGLTMSYLKSRIRSENLFDLEKEDQASQASVTIIISIVVGLLWFIIIPIWLVYKLGKKIFK